jgi:hypothetical protein
MHRSTKLLRMFIAAALFTLLTGSMAVSEDLVVRGCPDLLRLADSCRDDVKTADMVLGSVIDAGSIDMIKNYKLRKQAAQKQLESVLKALDLKGCVKPR